MRLLRVCIGQVHCLQSCKSRAKVHLFIVIVIWEIFCEVVFDVIVIASAKILHTG